MNPGKAILSRISLSPELLAHQSVRNFDCGPDPWSIEVTEWFHAPVGTGGAADDLQSGDTSGSIFITNTGEVVGFCAYGPSFVSWPKNSSPRQPAFCIAYLGVDHRHQRNGYGKIILQDTLGIIQSLKTSKLVVLYVRVGNPAAKLYREFGFKDVGKPKLTPEGHENQRMILKLPSAP
jgi:ribosomal protein S18 acetylase RimI-like enzyme